jgi:sugar O-acyltransferase (sialic acid O-acetyltransferase NeuD family)
VRPAGRIAVLGSGGHAKVVIATLQAAGHDVAAVFDDDPATWGALVLGVAVAGPIAALLPERFESGVVAVGDNAARRDLAGRVGLRWLTPIHPAAWVDPSARIGPGTVVGAGAVIQPEAVVGAHAIINTRAIVEHDCAVGNFAHLAPGACLAGGVRVGEGTLVGIGAAVIPGCRIGSWSIVGAGAVVVRDLPDGVVAVGVPARPR